MQNNKPKAVIAWSTGKDSAYAYYMAKIAGDFQIVGLLTNLTENINRVSVHGVREELLDLQVQNVGLPCHKVYMPSPCSNEIYEQKTRDVTDKLKLDGVTHVIFGDLYIEDIRDYRINQMKRAGLSCVFPLWEKDTTRLSQEMIDSGLRSIITCIDPNKLDKSFAGREFGPEFLADLPDNIDPCGENGEFHSVVIKGPMLKNNINVKIGEVKKRDHYIYADVIPVGN